MKNKKLKRQKIIKKMKIIKNKKTKDENENN